MTALNPDAWVQGWLPSLTDPFQPPDPGPADGPGPWRRPGGDPHQPDPGLDSEFEMQACLRGGQILERPRRSRNGSAGKRRRRR